MSYMAMKEFLQEQDRRMETKTSEKKYTLKEIAQKICDSYDDCKEGECPGFNYCEFKKANGILVWLRKVVEG